MEKYIQLYMPQNLPVIERGAWRNAFGRHCHAIAQKNDYLFFTELSSEEWKMIALLANKETAKHTFGKKG